MISYNKGNGFMWVRIFGYGLCIKDTTKYPLMFSERNGYVKRLALGKWSIKLLKNQTL